MKFKQWLVEDEMVASTGGPGPEEHGLMRGQSLSHPGPDSEKARKLFGIKKPPRYQKKK